MSELSLVSEDLLARDRLRQQTASPELWELLDTVTDPEIPVISIWDLGVLQNVSMQENFVKVVITPTYSGCPAMREIESDICRVLSGAGYSQVEVVTRLSPAWSTDWMSDTGKQQLMAFGISPPTPTGQVRTVICPQCAATNTTLISEFGSTACKALYRCEECLEAFDHFKCI